MTHIKSISEYLRENFWDTINDNTRLFFMVKLTHEDGETSFFYHVTNKVVFDDTLSPKAGCNTIDDAKNFMWRSFFYSTKNEIIKEYSTRFPKAKVDLFVKKDWLLDVNKKWDEMKEWMRITYTKATSSTNNILPTSVGGYYGEYVKKVKQLQEERAKEEKPKEDTSDELVKQTQEMEKRKEEFIKNLTPEEKEEYSRFGYPWEHYHE